MDKKLKILLIILVLTTIISIGYTFYKTLIKQDFEIMNTEPAVDKEILQEEEDLLTNQNND